MYHALKDESWCDAKIVHTGQHYDVNMSDAFFHDLGLPEPDYNLGVGSGNHAEQTAGVMVAYERVCMRHKPAWVIVVGDVNSTVACALVAAKLDIKVAHLEAGLRSRDRSMPEEINRIVTDVLSDLLWTPSPDGDENLRNEGIPEHKIERVGNIMIDSLELLREKIEADTTAKQMDLVGRDYGLLTLHRPSNVDDEEVLSTIVEQTQKACKEIPLVFAIHPRTRLRLREFGLLSILERTSDLTLTDPLGYIEFMNLVINARLLITDSGGIQEETTYLNIPCLTLRANTERPITISQGTNKLVRPPELLSRVVDCINGDWPSRICPELWDGKTAHRVSNSLKERLQQN